MSEKITRLWYASYGSNLMENRFLCYIRGGKPPGALRTYAGCTDTTPPRRNESLMINAGLYFARQSKTWSAGGVGFIKPNADPQEKTFARSYLISAEQFTELVKQEIRWKGDFKINMEALVENGSIILNERSWYNKILFLGFLEGAPIVTFTNQHYLSRELNTPDEKYLLMIINGLRETWNLSNTDIEYYLKNKPGIKGTDMEKNLRKLLEEN